MDNPRLLACFEADFGHLRSAVHSADLAAPVPTCPGWTLDDLTRHVAAVYLHKVECMRLGSHPDPWPPASLADEPAREQLDRGHAELVAQFAARQPTDPTFTWYGPDQTVGFWIRRMAQETVIHRVDAEVGAGRPVSEIPADLAEDGIDELLVAFVEFGSTNWPDEYGDVLAATTGATVRIETPGRTWLVRPTPAGVRVSAPREDSTVESGDDAAVVTGDPAEVLLWLWSRGGDTVKATGDPVLLDTLRRILTTSTG